MNQNQIFDILSNTTTNRNPPPTHDSSWMFKLIKESKESKLFDLFDYVSTLYLGLFTAEVWLKHTRIQLYKYRYNISNSFNGLIGKYTIYE